MCMISCSYIQREGNEIEEITLFFSLLGDFCICWTRDLNTLCAYNSSLWKRTVLECILFIIQCCYYPKAAFGFWFIYKQGKHVLNGLSQVDRGLFSEPLLHRAMLPLPSVTLYVGMCWLGQFLLHWPSATGAWNSACSIQSSDERLNYLPWVSY